VFDILPEQFAICKLTLGTFTQFGPSML